MPFDTFTKSPLINLARVARIDWWAREVPAVSTIWYVESGVDAGDIIHSRRTKGQIVGGLDIWSVFVGRWRGEIVKVMVSCGAVVVPGRHDGGLGRN